MTNYLIKEEKGIYLSSPCVLLEGGIDIRHELRRKILLTLNNKPMCPSDLAKVLGIQEQKVYYHIKQMLAYGLLEVSEKKEIRGTVAKKLKPCAMNFALALSKEWKPLKSMYLSEINKKLKSLLGLFIKDGSFNGLIVVGSPDPHGPFKARARDGHYAIELAFFLGSMLSLAKDFTTKLDVDISLNSDKNLILVGGPVTNQLVSQVNASLPVKFSDKKPWGITSERTNKKYTEETIGIVSTIPNPLNSEKHVIVIAGISAVGTKAAVLAFSRHYHLLLHHFTGQKQWGTVVNGFDFDGDGHIDDVEILE